jgi:alkylation response protein AidB-like acyl-CoA dehydrogenase
MAAFVRERAVIAAAVSEPDQDLTRPSTTARFDGQDWVINGRKIFSSMAPAATHFSVSVNYTDDRGQERYAYAFVRRDTPGVTVHDDWDALGMRASGSVSVSFAGVKLPGRGPGKGSIAGRVTGEHLEQILPSGPSHMAASVGVAEAAHRAGVEAFQSKYARVGEKAFRPTLQHFAAENVVELAAIRGVFDRSLRLIDGYIAEHPTRFGTLEETHAVFSEAQAAKAFVNQAVLRIVDRAMAIAGGMAYSNNHVLSRLYRDARAGAFMHPLGANAAYEYLGSVALGIEPQNL